MTIEQLREAHQNKPFRPFKISLADGRQFDVPHPEFLLTPPHASRTFVVAKSPDVYSVIDLLLVTSIDFVDGKTKRTRRS
jgi:hypothetical protein